MIISIEERVKQGEYKVSNFPYTYTRTRGYFEPVGNYTFTGAIKTDDTIWGVLLNGLPHNPYGYGMKYVDGSIPLLYILEGRILHE